MKIKTYTNLKLKSLLIFLLDLIIFNFLSLHIYKFIYWIDIKHGFYLIKIQVIWYIISYVTGRYTQYNIGFRKWFTKYISRNLICLILFANFIFLKILILQEQFYRPDLISMFTIMFFISFFVLLLFSIIYKKSERLFYNKNFWIYVGNQSDFNSFKAIINSTNRSFIIKHFKNVEILSKSKEKSQPNLSGIIIKEDFDISKNLPNRWQELRASIGIYSEIDWAREFLQRIPSNLVNEKNLILTNSLPHSSSFQLRIKRIADIFISLFILIFSSPLIILICILIYFEDGKPIFYSQIRNGLGTSKIKIYKLRTMKVSAEERGPQWSKTNDPRITKIGRIIRKLRLDELPQLLLVISGQMSLIGPRPERPEIDNELENMISHYKVRYFIKPGLSGWAQVNYPYGASINDSEIKLSYDLYYLYNFSFWIDFLILIKTVKLVLNAKGAIPKK